MSIESLVNKGLYSSCTLKIVSELPKVGEERTIYVLSCGKNKEGHSIYKSYAFYGSEFIEVEEIVDDGNSKAPYIIDIEEKALRFTSQKAFDTFQELWPRIKAILDSELYITVTVR